MTTDLPDSDCHEGDHYQASVREPVELLWAAREGDEIYINDRLSPLTITAKDWTAEDGDYLVQLRDDGTAYACRIDRESPSPVVLSTGDGEDIIVRTASLDASTALVSDVRAAEFLSQWDQDIR